MVLYCKLWNFCDLSVNHKNCYDWFIDEFQFNRPSYIKNNIIRIFIFNYIKDRTVFIDYHSNDPNIRIFGYRHDNIL